MDEIEMKAAEALQRVQDEKLEKVLPKRRKGERRKAFMDRCMSDAKINEEFPDRGQRFAVCQGQAAKSLEE